MTDPMVELKRLTTERISKMHQEFTERLDKELAAAHVAGRDLAVSEFEWEEVPAASEAGRANRLQVIFLPLSPGEDPPRGRHWTVYQSSGAETPGVVEPNWVEHIRPGSRYEEEMDTNASPPRWRHREKRSTGEPYAEWKDGPAPEKAGVDYGELNRLLVRDREVWWAERHEGNPAVTIHARRLVEPTREHGAMKRLDETFTFVSIYGQGHGGDGATELLKALAHRFEARIPR